VRSICLHLLNNRRYSPASPDESERRRGVEVITQAIGVCKDIGAKVILIPFFGAAIISSEETKELLIAELQKCAETAEVEEVYLAVESTLSAEEALKVVRSVDSPYVKVYFDVGNALWQGYDPVKEIEALGKEIVQVHIKDTQNKPLGEGQVNLKAALGALRKIGYDGYLVLETPSVPDPIKAAKANLEYLKKQMP
jgi:sugar phosphate isomerase/epimerase